MKSLKLSYTSAYLPHRKTFGDGSRAATNGLWKYNSIPCKQRTQAICVILLAVTWNNHYPGSPQLLAGLRERTPHTIILVTETAKEGPNFWNPNPYKSLHNPSFPCPPSI